MNLIIASNNEHKIREFREILQGKTVLGPHDLSINFYHEEIADSFAMNALGKAAHLWQLVQNNPQIDRDSVVIADDSGLVVPALDNAPGVYSARYGAQSGRPDLTDQDRNQLLLSNMQQITSRRAYYVCAMVLFRGVDAFDCVQETWEGEIAGQESRGTGGFGYDPLFWLPSHGCTVAELEQGIKSRISHRAKAMRRLMKLIDI